MDKDLIVQIAQKCGFDVGGGFILPPSGGHITVQMLDFARTIFAAATPSITDTRAAFEQKFKLCIRQAVQRKDGGYRDPIIHARWEGWLERGEPEQDDADHHTIMRMGELLAGIAVALKGPEEASKRHGYQDLPQLVQALMFEVAMLKQQLADYAAMYEPFKAMVDDASDAKPLPEIATVPMKIQNADGLAEWADVCTEEQTAPAKEPVAWCIADGDAAKFTVLENEAQAHIAAGRKVMPLYAQP